MQQSTKKAIATALLFAAFVILYRSVIAKLFHDLWTDENYSHGLLILPMALYFAWERRKRLLAAELRPNNAGLILVLGSLGILAIGVLGFELFLTRISMLGILTGALLFVCGWRPVKILAFPILFLLLMIPIPTIVFNQIAFPLQLLASRFGEAVLMAFGIPVLREGNVIHLANTSLEVAEACSGIRSLISLLTIGIVYGYFTDSRISVRIILALATIPTAIAANGARISGTGIAARYYGPEVAEGFLHSFSGWIIFLVAFLMLFLLHRGIDWIAPGSEKALVPPGVPVTKEEA
jgi:exosortase